LSPIYNMNQHLISEVYLKQFGYQDKNSQWRICTLEKSKLPIMLKNDKRWISHKSIGSFLSIDNYFDFENYDDLRFTRVIEETSSEVETYFPILIDELNSNEKISQKGEAILAHYISNLYVRTSNFDLLLDDLIQLGAHDRFLEECLMFDDDTYKHFIFKLIENQKFNTNKNVKNLSRFLFWNYFWQRLAYFEYYILKPFEGKGWISSDNPVILNNHVDEDSLISFETEIIFPFSKSILILFKMPESKQVSKIFENTLLKHSIVASSEVNDEINNIIMDNLDNFLIVPDIQEYYTF
jgi:Protein of unknown function (DUF4238)